MREESRIVELIILELQGKLTPAEQVELDAWRAESDLNKAFANQFNDTFTEEYFRQIEAIDLEEGKQRLMEKAGLEFPHLQEARPTSLIRKMQIRRLVAAASIIGFLAISTYFFFGRDGQPATAPTLAATQKDLSPGANKAMLYLADQTSVNLDSVGTGKIATQGQAAVIRKEDGLLVYSNDRPPADENEQVATAKDVLYNTLVTPKGGQYRMVLPDGSRVWLNAASSIKYPTTFEQGQRKVAITGEVYFEVAKKAGAPFIVEFSSGAVEVLGTHFNINTYGDGQAVAATTLLEGSVKISGGRSGGSARQSMILKPGQQAAVNSGNSLSLRTAIDIDEVMAWKLGYFNIDNRPLREVMQQISRWYDCEVQYKTQKNPNLSFKIKRNVPVSELLQILQKIDAIDFALEGRTIVVQ